uniref:J domain-containing protein n=1 Tax=Callorhinchus milii TaxID=7868 RepID=A0A4W3GMX1_CALMI|eukprot:gi/632991221/ref/XP_007884529.1/ PREDICTED: dnaJ homolog subfamily C member 14 [Callorhinchus milii]
MIAAVSNCDGEKATRCRTNPSPVVRTAHPSGSRDTGETSPARVPETGLPLPASSAALPRHRRQLRFPADSRAVGDVTWQAGGWGGPAHAEGGGSACSVCAPGEGQRPDPAGARRCLSEGCEHQSRDREAGGPGAPDHRLGGRTETPQGNGGPSLLHPKSTPPPAAEPPLGGCFGNGDAKHSTPSKPENNASFADDWGCVGGSKEEDEEEEEEGEDEGGELCYNASGSPWKPAEEEEEDGRHSGKPISGGRKSSRRQRHKSGAKDGSPGEKEEEGRGGEQARREARPGSASGKHRHGRGERKRQHPDSRERPRAGANSKPAEEALRLCVSYVKILTDVILFVTHKCGEYVEAGGRLLYSCCRVRRGDWDSFRSRLRTSGGRLLARSRLGSESLRLAGLSSLRNGLRVLKLLLALLFLALIFLLGLVRLCYRYGKMGVSRSLGGGAGADCFGRFPSASFLRRLRSAAGRSRTWDCVRRLWGKAKGKFWRPDKWRTATGHQQHSQSPAAPTTPTSTSSPAAGREQPEQEVQRLLSMAHVPEDDLDPFKVLGLEVTATDAELKKAYRQLAILVHPDKNPHPRSEEAFKVVRAAWDIVSNPERRKEYEM